jgi:hypothetical protein
VGHASRLSSRCPAAGIGVFEEELVNETSMIKEYQLRLLPQQAVNESTIKDYLSREE